MSFEPHNDDVLSVTPSDLSPVNHPTLKISQLVQAFKNLHSTYKAWLGDGVECEFLSTNTATGWQTGKIRLRFEFVPDVPDEPEPSLDSSALAPLPEQLNSQQ
jgi:hypothetical protein